MPATGIAGVPTAVQIERNAVRQRVAGVMLMPAAVAMNVMAIICIAVVPFILIVIPVGRTKLLISSEQPSSLIQVSLLSGSVAADEFVAAANIPIFAAFLRKINGLSPVVTKMPIG